MGAVARSIGDGGRAFALAAGVALALWSGGARAQKTEARAQAGQEDTQAPSLVQPSKMSDQDEEARALYKAGVIAFDSGRFRNALDAFQRAYELSQRPELLYNVGSVADRLRLDAVALDAFERYLQAVPESPHAPSVQARIDVLRKAVEAQRQEQTEPLPEVEDQELEEPAEAVPPPPPPPEKPSWPKWTLIGAGGGALAAGVVVLALGQRNRGKIEGAAAGTPFSDVSQYENANTLTAAGAAIAGVGLAAALAGTLWLVLDDKGDRQVALGITPGGLSLGGTL